MTPIFTPFFGSPDAHEGAEGIWAWQSGPVDTGIVRLSPEETARVEKLVDPEKRARLGDYLKVRKHLIAILLGLPAEDVRLSHDLDGKPFLIDVPHVSTSFSDTQEWNALALERSVPVGVDLEQVRDIGWDAMLPMISDAEEAALVRDAVEASNDLSPFFRCWTAKEAVLKAAGTGMRGGARRVLVPADLIYGRTSTAYSRKDDAVYSVDCAALDQVIIVRARRTYPSSRIDTHIGPTS